MAGHGIRLAGAADAFLELVDLLGIPVVTAICGHDLIPSDHPLFFGRPGIVGDRRGNMVVQNSDCFVAIGARLGVRQIGYSYEAFARGAFRAMVDIDDAELRKPTLRLDLPIHCDARIFIEEMLRLARQTPLAPKPSWIQWCRELDTHLPGIHDDNPAPQGAVSSYEFAERLFDRLGDGDLVVTGNGTAYTGTFQVMRLRRGVRVFTNQGCASMGYDLPAAIGACIARDRKPVVCITGDGSIQMNIQELQTIVALNLPIRIFVLNNCGYLAIRTTQNTYFEGRYVGSCPEGGVSCPDMLRIANAYGIPAQRVSDPGDLDAALDATLKAEGPVICEVMMDPNQTLYPKLSSVVRPDGAMISKPLEDMYPLLRRDLFKKLMQITPLD